jgi:hypothetical protein
LDHVHDIEGTQELLKPSIAKGACADESVLISESRRGSIGTRLSEVERKVDIFLQARVSFEAVKPKSRSTNKRNALRRARRLKKAAVSKEAAALEVAPLVESVEPQCIVEDSWATPEDHDFVAESGDSAISEAGASKQLSRLIRAHQKRFYELKRCLFKRTKPEPKPKEDDPIHPVKVVIDDRNGVTPHLVNGRNLEIGITTKTTPHQFRKKLIRKLKLKGVVWRLERWNPGIGEFQWFEIAACSSVKKGDIFRIQIMRSRKLVPNAPGTSKRTKYERANQREKRRLGLKSYVWNPKEGKQLADVSVATPPA